MAKAPLLAVEDALARILSSLSPIVSQENVPLIDSGGRILAKDLAATRDQPPFTTSAMDGYAVRVADLTDASITTPARLQLIGESAAGHGFKGAVTPGTCARIFTGAPLPSGADTILIQENAAREGAHILASAPESYGRFVRPQGLDFKKGEVLLKQGKRLDAMSLALAAAMNHAQLPVIKRPRIAILATGDELVNPSDAPADDQIIASNSYGIAEIARNAGAEPLLLPIAKDTLESLDQAIVAAENAGAHMLVTIGGASVGDHDLVQKALLARGMQPDFWRIAMRPGKPLMYGTLPSGMHVLGLPGNPVSSLICSLIFLRPAIGKLLGRAHHQPIETALLGAALPANDERQDYLRATLHRDAAGMLIATPFPKQDSSMLRTLAQSEALIIRAPFAEVAASGTTCNILKL